jgi:hypothetical protein
MARYLPDHYKVANVVKGEVPDKIKRAFLRKKICYVLISCEEPNSKGEMEVEMTFDGDLYLAGYLTESAKQMLEEKM